MSGARTDPKHRDTSRLSVCEARVTSGRPVAADRVPRQDFEVEDLVYQLERTAYLVGCGASVEAWS